MTRTKNKNKAGSTPQTIEAPAEGSLSESPGEESIRQRLRSRQTTAPHLSSSTSHNETATANNGQASVQMVSRRPLRRIVQKPVNLLVPPWFDDIAPVKKLVLEHLDAAYEALPPLCKDKVDHCVERYVGARKKPTEDTMIRARLIFYIIELEWLTAYPYGDPDYWFNLAQELGDLNITYWAGKAKLGISGDMDAEEATEPVYEAWAVGG